MADTPSVRSRIATFITTSLLILLLIGFSLMIASPAGRESLKSAVHTYRSMNDLLQILLSSYPADEIEISIVADAGGGAVIVTLIQPLWEEPTVIEQEEIARQIADFVQDQVPARLAFDEIRIVFVPSAGEAKTYSFDAATLLRTPNKEWYCGAY
jgi:hypothetical protein